MIVERNGKYEVMNKAGTRCLGRYETSAEADTRQEQVSKRFGRTSGRSSRGGSKMGPLKRGA